MRSGQPDGGAGCGNHHKTACITEYAVVYRDSDNRVRAHVGGVGAHLVERAVPCVDNCLVISAEERPAKAGGTSGHLTENESEVLSDAPSLNRVCCRDYRSELL